MENIDFLPSRSRFAVSLLGAAALSLGYEAGRAASAVRRFSRAARYFARPDRVRKTKLQRLARRKTRIHSKRNRARIPLESRRHARRFGR